MDPTRTVAVVEVLVEEGGLGLLVEALLVVLLVEDLPVVLALALVVEEPEVQDLLLVLVLVLAVVGRCFVESGLGSVLLPPRCCFPDPSTRAVEAENAVSPV